MIQPGDSTPDSEDGDAESMHYGLLGEDNNSEIAKLEKYTGEVDWPYLKNHFETGSLLYVDPALDLVEVGRALSEDDADSVRAWKSTGDLLQPSAPHAAFWEETEAKFLALVVSPFVLIQPID